MDSTSVIAHPDLNETDYIVSGTGTVITGSDFVDMESSISSPLVPMERG